jgi:hypothetical protein
MFKKILIASAITAAFSVSANAAQPNCNPAVQNWENGSQLTCQVYIGSTKNPVETTKQPAQSTPTNETRVNSNQDA